MSAVISTIQRAGIGYSATDVAKIEFEFLPIDSNIADSSDYPMEVPQAGTSYSYEDWLAFRCDVAPDSYCKNFRIWTSGNLSNGVKITINSTDIQNYTAPVNSKSTQGTRADLLDYTSSNKLSITGELNNIGDITNWMVFQLEFTPQAQQGFDNFTIYYEYEEL